ncbi:receptor-transporting protein 3 [Microcaecilia unicolor]|uniref:Receptor-transporting protein 3-like n=1 Tax=Microcaecilia unicolor TaxID=1415580 RepID=A0A6P7YYL7_9AMPH|nr:receptor-transporting protein 3-like [Microcaecilia unicolor]XP_030072228.1 receptor-transporting protein 3-like [Microcaecilia unicolor]XP_030072229.1 receptor-transporting protein 3-like [Microcaecilia unicolor]
MELSTFQEAFQEKMNAMRKRDTWTLQLCDTFQSSPEWRQFQLSSSARFHCTNCKRSWASNQVHILFLIKLDKFRRRGWVKMRIFKQECKHCKSAKFQEPEFTPQNLEITFTKLQLRIQKICYGLKVPKNPDLVPVYSTKGPHEKDHCEACRLGVCKWIDYDEGQRDHILADDIQNYTANAENTWLYDMQDYTANAENIRPHVSNVDHTLAHNIQKHTKNVRPPVPNVVSPSPPTPPEPREDRPSPLLIALGVGALLLWRIFISR